LILIKKETRENLSVRFICQMFLVHI